MTAFYEDLVDHYDKIFPAEPEIVSFLAGSMHGRKNILDIACGTGTYALELAARGFRVTGIDLEERMIERAKEKTRTATADFHVADMTGKPDAHAVFTRSFDGVYCIGNSLPHLPGIAQVKKALELWWTILGPGGVLIVQTVNFKRFSGRGGEDLPPVEGEGFVFSRRYFAAAPGAVDFTSVLSMPRRGTHVTNTVRLLALDRETLDETLLDTGYRDIDYYGNYAGEPYDAGTSFLMICRARKPLEPGKLKASTRSLSGCSWRPRDVPAPTRATCRSHFRKTAGSPEQGSVRRWKSGRERHPSTREACRSPQTVGCVLDPR
ncbi:MAG: class I SAM-dependent methyltransferase [Spirochaetales bacterium]|nr:class I SAM-dependent methyltransferase [Spirochaetales bacterium]